MKTELRNTRSEVQQARLKWINTMDRRYPGFNPKTWEQNSTYRNSHPQPAIK